MKKIRANIEIYVKDESLNEKQIEELIGNKLMEGKEIVISGIDIYRIS